MDCPKRKCGTEAAASGLPDDPLVEILSRVPVKSLCRFKCVSKPWRDLIADPDHRKKLPQTLEGFFFMDPEHRDGGGDDCGSDDDEPPRQFYCFVDVLKSSVRTVDLSYLSELPGPGILEETRLLHCCNGLLLFAARYNNDGDISESYIVCNPATKQCVAVPSSGLAWKQMISKSMVTSLLFNPGVRWHFNLFVVSVASGRVYSSETQAWSHTKIDWDSYPRSPKARSPYSLGVYFNGMLHLLSYLVKDRLTVVDVEGNIQKIILAPCQQVGRTVFPFSGYVGQSQGCLYYICRDRKVNGFGREVSDRLLIWVLQDYNRQQWVLKDSVVISKMFGKRDCDIYYNVVGIHPDHSLVFLVQYWDQKLISYNMDSKEVRDLCTLGHGYKRIVHGYKSIIPYVPNFTEFGA